MHEPLRNMIWLCSIAYLEQQVKALRELKAKE
jgi:hypothetical protein